LAARLQAEATPNSMIVCDKTHRLAGGAFEYQDLGRITLKGIPEPQHVWRVMDLCRIESRFESVARGTTAPMIGRDQELNLLLERWQFAQQGEGQAVLLCSEPGIGKSRTLKAVRDRLGKAIGITLQAQCSNHHTNSSLYPMTELMERMLEFRREEPVGSKFDRLDALVTDRYGLPALDARLIAEMLAMPVEAHYGPLDWTPERRKEEMLRALADLVVAMARKLPTLMLFEDVHWADPTTLEWIEVLIGRLAQVPLLVLITHRPEFKPSWTRFPNVSALTLNRLSHAQSAAIVARVAGNLPLPSDLVQKIIAKTDGVPLFLEELTKSALESGMIKNAGGYYEYTGSADLDTLPSTLRSSLMARLDRMIPVKEIAQIGACIGREFAFEEVAAVSSMSEWALAEALEKLTATELIFRAGTPPNTRYLFKHALVQEVAYDSLLKSKRQELHARIAKTIEAREPGRRNSEPELLAHHYMRAGHFEAALPCWIAAGQRSFARVALHEAASHFGHALEANEDLAASPARDAKELEIRLALASAYFALLGWAAAEVPRILGPAKLLARALSDGEKLTSILYYLWFHHGMRCEYQAADSLIEELYALAESSGDSGSLITALMTDACTRCWKGDFAGCLSVAGQLVNSYDPAIHGSLANHYNHDPKCLTLMWASAAQWSLGFPDQALQLSREQLDWARELGHVWNLLWSLTGGGVSLMYRGDTGLMLEHCDEARSMGKVRAMNVIEYAVFPFWGGFGLIAPGAFNEGRERLSAGSQVWAASGGVHEIPMSKIYLAQAELAMGNSAQAESLAREALDLIERTGHRMDEAESHRMLGEALMHKRDFAAAERAFTKSIEVARSQHAKGWELRATLSFARLLLSQDKRAIALELLAPVHDWFTQGFDTKDLREARAMMSELA
ncbi:MAG: AAA family ATPase, partial [Burkholderiales bacterium]